MAGRSSLPLTELVTGPRLRELLADTSVSYSEAAHLLRSEFNVRVSHETLRRWASELGYPARNAGDDEEQVA